MCWTPCERLATQSVCYKIAAQVNRKSHLSSLLISDWLRDYPQENVVPLYFVVKHAQNWDFVFINSLSKRLKYFKCPLPITTSYWHICIYFLPKAVPQPTPLSPLQLKFWTYRYSWSYSWLALHPKTALRGSMRSDTLVHPYGK